MFGSTLGGGSGSPGSIGGSTSGGGSTPGIGGTTSGGGSISGGNIPRGGRSGIGIGGLSSGFIMSEITVPRIINVEFQQLHTRSKIKEFKKLSGNKNLTAERIS